MKLRILLAIPAFAFFMASCSEREVITEKETIEKETTVSPPAAEGDTTIVVPTPAPAPTPAPTERETIIEREIIVPVPVPTPEEDSE